MGKMTSSPGSQCEVLLPSGSPSAGCRIEGRPVSYGRGLHFVGHDAFQALVRHHRRLMETSICAGARGRNITSSPAYVHAAGRELLRTRLRSVLLNGVASPRPPSMQHALPSRPSAAAALIVGWGSA
jgi:hypothetical protein